VESKHPVTRHRASQGGYALLFVFLLAGSISIMLLSQMPRVAFESQRDREQMLVDRGEQFKRAIQMYYVKTKKFPQRIEDLENTNNVRFLRRRYIDPMTGKDEWRVIHVNAAGQLTDSLVQKPPSLDPSKDKEEKDKLAAAAAANPADAAQDLNAFARQRPSDRMPGGLPSGAPAGFPGQPVDPNAPPSSFADPNAPANPAVAPYPGYVPPSGVNANGISVPQGLQPGQNVPGANGLPGTFPVNAQGLPGTYPPNAQGLPGAYPGAPANSQNGGVSPFQPGAVPFPQPGTQVSGNQPGNFNPGTFGPGGAAPPNPAMNLINQIITTPRQNPTQPGISTTNSTNQFGSGGIAGFASTYTGTGIKLYKERKKYQEWEFVFDLKELLGQQQNGQTPQNNNPLGRGSSSGSGSSGSGSSGSGSSGNGFTFGGSGGNPPPPRP